MKTVRHNSLHRAVEEMQKELSEHNITVDFGLRFIKCDRQTIYLEPYVAKEKIKSIFRQLIRNIKTDKRIEDSIEYAKLARTLF